MTQPNVDPSAVSYIAFGMPPGSRWAALGAGRVMGNVVELPTDDLQRFLSAANPEDLVDLVERNPTASALELGRLAVFHSRLGKPQEVTATVMTLLAEVNTLMQDLPEGFRADFAGDQDNLPLRIQKTPGGDLLVGLVAPSSTPEELGDRQDLLYALFGPDGKFKGYSSGYAYAFDANGTSSFDAFLPYEGELPSLDRWLNYLPGVVRLVQAYQAGDAADIEAGLAVVYASLRDKKAPTLPLFLDALAEADRQRLLAQGILPVDFIPSSRPNATLMRGLRYKNVAKMLEALATWKIPCTEVTYTAGAREIGARNVEYDKISERLPETFNSEYDLLPADFEPTKFDNRHDIVVHIDAASIARSDLSSQEVVVYDGSQSTVGRLTPPLSLPPILYDPKTKLAPAVALHQEAFRPTRHTVRPRGSAFAIKQSPADGSSFVTISGWRLALSPEQVAKLKNMRVEGGGEFLAYEQRITVEYHLFDGRLVPIVVDTDFVQRYERSRVDA